MSAAAWRSFCLGVTTLLAAACTASVKDAPCSNDESCLSGQICSNGLCVAGSRSHAGDPAPGDPTPADPAPGDGAGGDPRRPFLHLFSIRP